MSNANIPEDVQKEIEMLAYSASNLSKTEAKVFIVGASHGYQLAQEKIKKLEEREKIFLTGGYIDFWVEKPGHNAVVNIDLSEDKQKPPASGREFWIKDYEDDTDVETWQTIITKMSPQKRAMEPEFYNDLKNSLHVREVTPEREKAIEKLVEVAKELRIYCLGSDASTENMIEKFDKILAEWEKVSK